MISSIRGRVINKYDDSVDIELGGISLQVFIPAQTKESLLIGDTIHLFTYLSVREDSLTLYGFSTSEERDYFVLLIGVNGIGPRLGLAGLSTLNPEAIRRAIFTEQVEVFCRIPGIGKKTALKIMLHLQDRIKSVDGFAPVSIMDDQDTQVLEALVALGYSVVEAQAALQAIPLDSPKDVESRIRMALQYFSG